MRPFLFNKKKLKSIRISQQLSKSGLFTGQDCCSGEEVAHEAVVNYRKGATTKPMW